MSHRLIAVVTAWTLVVMVVLGCAAGLALQLELGLGSELELLSFEGYAALHTAHGGIMSHALGWTGLFGPVAHLQVAREREAAGRVGGPSAWLAGVGMVATVGLAVTVTLAVLGWVDAAWWATLGWFGAVARVGLGLGAVAGLIGVRRSPRSTVLNATVVIVGLALVFVAGVDVRAGLGARTSPFFGLSLGLHHALAVGLVLGAMHQWGGERGRAWAIYAVVAFAAAGVFDGLGASTRGMTPLLLISGWIATLIAWVKLGLGLAPGPEPARAYLPVFASLALLALGFRLYIDSLAVEVHLGDTYIIVADLHLSGLSSLAVGGVFALRYFAPQRYAPASRLVRVATAWVLATAVAALVCGQLYLGWWGMPRRYAVYLPEYLGGHRWVAAAGGLIVAALLVEAALWVRSGRLLGPVSPAPERS